MSKTADVFLRCIKLSELHAAVELGQSTIASESACL